MIVPGPGRYRPILNEVIKKLSGGKASAETQDVMLEAIMDVDQAERLILCQDNFLGSSTRALEHGQLYHKVADKARQLRNLFPDNPVEFFIGIRDPATFVPALFEHNGGQDFVGFTKSFNPLELYWSDMIASLQEAAPDCPVTVWCNEDTPMIWPEVMHEIAGVEPQVKLMGGFDILSGIMAKEGVKRLRDYLGSNPPQNEIQRRRILAAFLDKYALEDEIEEVLDLPGWTADLTAELTAAYDDDVLEISRLQGVTMLTA
ncbi:MAG: hypothetical protein GY945_00575 [Rhodobacteraceae bacterium]|nr:hypothetical protein [Paracoccaceae bacterium]